MRISSAGKRSLLFGTDRHFGKTRQCGDFQAWDDENKNFTLGPTEIENLVKIFSSFSTPALTA